MPPDEERLLEDAARQLNVSKSEFVRRSILALASQVTAQTATAEADIDAQLIGKGGGLRDPADVTNARRHTILQRLRAKHGYAG
jgi:Arc/MetJ-type ribon-helix-helix transcriptional regulator